MAPSFSSSSHAYAPLSEDIFDDDYAPTRRFAIPQNANDILNGSSREDVGELDFVSNGGLRRRDEEQEQQELISENLQRASVANITMNTLNYMLVPLSMPATFKAAGWTFGTFCFVWSTAWSYWTGRVIGRAYLEHPDLKTYPEMAASACDGCHDTTTAEAVAMPLTSVG